MIIVCRVKKKEKERKIGWMLPKGCGLPSHHTHTHCTHAHLHHHVSIKTRISFRFFFVSLVDVDSLQYKYRAQIGWFVYFSFSFFSFYIGLFHWKLKFSLFFFTVCFARNINNQKRNLSKIVLFLYIWFKTSTF